MRSIESPTCARFMIDVVHYLDEGRDSSVRAFIEAHELDCEQCRSYLEQLIAVKDILGALRSTEKQYQLAPEVLAIFQEWKSGTVKDLGSEASSDPPTILAELLDCKPAWRQVLIASSSRYQGHKLVAEALKRATSLAREGPIQAKRLAEIAVEVSKTRFEISLADKEQADENQRVLRADMTQAYAILGNIQRLCSDFLGAEQSLAEAFRHLPDDKNAAELKAQIFMFAGSLRSTLSEFDEAIQDFDQAIEIYRSIDNHKELGRCLLSKGLALSDAGSTESALVSVRSALELLQECDDRRLVLVGKHNLIFNLRAVGSYDEAMALMPETRALHAELGNGVDLARFKWLEGQIALEQGDLRVAEAAFDEVKDFFVEKGMAHDTALVSLDLATVYLEQSRLTELRSLSTEMLTIFEGLGTKRETRAALAFFEKAIEVERAQMEMVGDLLEYLLSVRLEERVVARLNVPS